MTVIIEPKAAVRMMCGDPDVEEISEDVIETFLGVQCLEWLNKRRPGEAISYFETVAGTQDYDVKPSNAYLVTNVFWMGGGYDIFSPSLRFLPSSMDMDERVAGFSAVDNPALVEIVYKVISQYKDNFKGTGVETDEAKIRLEPMPGATGEKVYFMYTYPRWTMVTLAVDVSSYVKYIEGIKLKAAALCLEYLAINRGLVVSARDFSGGAGRNENALAEKFHERAEAIIPSYMSIFTRG